MDGRDVSELPCHDHVLAMRLWPSAYTLHRPAQHCPDSQMSNLQNNKWPKTTGTDSPPITHYEDQTLIAVVRINVRSGRI